MTATKRILVTGASGKVGRAFIDGLLAHPACADFTVRALLHNRTLPPRDRLETVRGTIADRAFVDLALDGVTHVLHLATVKETPDEIMDVAIKGMFWLLEACRASPTFQQFILIGGDAAVGHIVYPRPIPVTETLGFMPYQGCYALSKVLEEVMLEQYYTQYNLNGCCLRAPWIMEKDDLKYTLSFGDDVFGGPRWSEMVGREKAAEYARAGTIPIMLDPAGKPVKRNFVHVDDLVTAILSAIDCPGARQQTFNVCMDEPIDYRALGNYLKQTRGLPTVEIVTEYHGTWLDNTKAKFVLGWRPQYDLARMIDSAFDYQRAEDDPRVIWYPG